MLKFLALLALVMDMQSTFLVTFDKYLKSSSWIFRQSSVTHINKHTILFFILIFFFAFQMHLQTTEPHYTLMVNIFYFEAPDGKKVRQIQK
jgi:hypothetical protein